MTYDWVKDIDSMHSHYGFHADVNKLTQNQLKELLLFRIRFLEEELYETSSAVEDQDPEEIVDGLIDLCVVSIGTLNLFGVDAHKAWNRVHEANMNKKVGVKPSRPNPLGLPDLMKPEGWTAPSHEGNHGILNNLFVDQGQQN